MIRASVCRRRKIAVGIFISFASMDPKGAWEPDTWILALLLPLVSVTVRIKGRHSMRNTSKSWSARVPRGKAA